VEPRVTEAHKGLVVFMELERNVISFHSIIRKEALCI